MVPIRFLSVYDPTSLLVNMISLRSSLNYYLLIVFLIPQNFLYYFLDRLFCFSHILPILHTSSTDHSILSYFFLLCFTVCWIFSGTLINLLTRIFMFCILTDNVSLIFCFIMKWSDIALLLVTLYTSMLHLRILLSTTMWSIWFLVRPSGDTQVYLYMFL